MAATHRNSASSVKPPPSESGAPTTESPPYGWAVGAGGLVFLLYAVTLAPTTAFWDTSEYIATAHILGIPHPPGNPLFVVLARSWELLLAPLGLSVAVKINLFSAVMGALAHGLWFLVVERILSTFTSDRRFRIAGALAAVLVSATAFTVWNQSNVNEKVYTVSLFTIALLTWLAFLWRENLGKGKDDNLLVLMIFILALSVGNHLMAFLAAPALAIFILLVHPRTLLNYRLYLAGGLAALVGLTIHLYLPLRASLDPIINEADPTCPGLGGALVSIVTYGMAGCEELSAVLTRQQYDKPPLIPRLAPLHAQLGNYLQYFDWQWARSLQGENYLFAAARLPFTLLFSALGIYGAVEHFRKDRKSAWYFLTLFATLSVALVFYLNFRYGYSWPAPGEGRGAHEVRERDYFFIASFSVWGLWAGVGIAALWSRLADRFGGGLGRAAPILALAVLPLILNWSWASRAGDYSARDWAYNLLMSVEPYGILFTNGDNDTFPLWYLQEVEGIRQDVTVMVTSYLNTPWYVKQLRDLTRPCPEGVDPRDDPTRIVCQRPYDPGAEEAVYVYDSGADPDGRTPIPLRSPTTPPDRPVLDLDDEIIERISETYVPLQERRAFQFDGVRVVLEEGQVVIPWHQFAMSILDQSLGVRPIYFASSGNAAQTLGLTPYLVRQGLAFRLNEEEIPSEAPPEGLFEITSPNLRQVTGPWVDVPRTRTLVHDVFVHRGGIPDEWSHWPDHSTVGIPNYFAWAHYSLAQVGIQQGDEDVLELNRERGDAWSRLGR